MALGRFTVRGTISSNTDTAVAPAPGLRERIHLVYVMLAVATAGTTSRARVENGAGGNVLARLATATADAMVVINASTGMREDLGRQLSENTALNINTSGAAAATIDYDITYEVRGA